MSDEPKSTLKNTPIVWSVVFSICTVCLTPIFCVALAASFSEGCGNLSAKDAPWGCGEFVMSRYQTLITGALAIAAAFIAVKPVYKQLALLRRDTAAAASASLQPLIVSLKAELDFTEQNYRKLNELASSIKEESMATDPWTAAVSEHAEHATRLIVELDKFKHINQTERPLMNARTAFRDSVSRSWKDIFYTEKRPITDRQFKEQIDGRDILFVEYMSQLLLEVERLSGIANRLALSAADTRTRDI